MGAQALTSRAVLGMMYATLGQPADGWIPKLSKYFSSDQSSEVYAGLGAAPPLREWVGGRIAKGLKDNTITIVNKEYEATLEVLKRELRQDKTGLIQMRIDDLARRANQHWAKLISDLLVDAESTVCYDGEYFFDDDHEEGDSGSQSNDITCDLSALPLGTGLAGTTTSPSAAAISYAILDGIQQLLSLKDDQGEPINEGASEFFVMAGPSFMAPLMGALELPNVATGITNPLTARMPGMTIEAAVNTRLTDWTTKLAVFRTDTSATPFFRQGDGPEGQDIEIDAQAEGSWEEFHNKRHLYGVSAYRGAGLAMWQGACLVTLT